MKYNERGIRDFKFRFGGENIENKNPCSDSSLDDVRHNFDFGKPIRVDVQDSESSSLKYLKVRSYFNDLCSFYH